LGTSETSKNRATTVALADNAAPWEGDTIATLHQLALALAECAELNEILRQALLAAARLTGSPHGTILLLDERGERISQRATLYSGNVAPLELVAGPMMRRGMAGWVVRERRAARVDDTERDERWLAGPGLGDLRSAIVAPLLYRGRALGVITLGHETPSHYDDRHLRLLEIIGAQVALALPHHRAPSAHAAGFSPVLEDDAAPPTRPSQREIVALAAELRGMTDLCARLAVGTFFDEILRTFFQSMADIVHRHAGVVDSIAGDGLLAIFEEAGAEAAARAAIEMQVSARRLRGGWRARLGVEVGGLDIGIAGGPAIVGQIGVCRAAGRVVGAAIGQAARLRELSRNNILASLEIAAALRASDSFAITALPPLRIGPQAPQRIFQIEPSAAGRPTPIRT
jgi:class 3 adenylate cyclase